MLANSFSHGLAILTKTCCECDHIYAIHSCCVSTDVLNNAVVVSYLGYLGVTLDKEANGVRGEEIVISTPDSKVKVMVIPTNEELAIARETLALVK